VIGLNILLKFTGFKKTFIDQCSSKGQPRFETGCPLNNVNLIPINTKITLILFHQSRIFTTSPLFLYILPAGINPLTMDKGYT
jgi:hypothetical protein